MNTRSETTRAFRRESSGLDSERIANGLGWFSLGLGIAEIAAPGAIADFIGIRSEKGKRALLRSPLYGMREVAAGAGILMQHQPASWLWGRVAGDFVDITSLAVALRSRENDRGRVAAALVGVLGVTALDYYCARQLSEKESNGRWTGRSNRSVKSIWVNKSPEEAYGFWHNFEQLPRFMRHLESVQTIGEGRSRWRATGPMGKTFEWEAHTEQDQPNRLIAWRSSEGSEVQNCGTVFFERGPGGRGAIVRVDLSYDPPGGTVGAGLAKLLGKDAGQMLEDDLRAFKQVIETGEVIQSDASVHPSMHPAQPTDERHELQREQPVHA
jgi:uncharacterized membrane protein